MEKSRLKSFIGGLVIGFIIGTVITYAIGATVVLNLLDK